MKVVVLDAYSAVDGPYAVQQKLFEENGIDFVLGNVRTREEAADLCRDADGILTSYWKVDGDLMDAAPSCRVIVRYGIGYDPIDVKAATQRGIPVCNIPDYCFEEVATHTMAMVLALTRKLPIFHARVRDGIWVSNGEEYPFRRLSTLTMGLVGFGNIARQTAAYAQAFGLKILAYDPFLTEEVFTERGAKKVELPELFAQSDIISLHVPLFDSTYHILNRESFAQMKDNVLIVNTSRGPLIDIEALVEALDSGKVAGAGLDVIEGEPIKEKNHPIFRTGRAIVTSHVAYNSTQATLDLYEKTAMSAIRVLQGERIPNIVNKKELYS